MILRLRVVRTKNQREVKNDDPSTLDWWKRRKTMKFKYFPPTTSILHHQQMHHQMEGIHPLAAAANVPVHVHSTKIARGEMRWAV